MAQLFPCQCCGHEYPDEGRNWYVCDQCNYRICPNCLGKHSGPYGSGGLKCGQCRFGYFQLRQNLRSIASSSKPTNKLEEYLSKLRTPQVGTTSIDKSTPKLHISISEEPIFTRKSQKKFTGIIFTDSSKIASKYKNTSSADVRSIIESFMTQAAKAHSTVWDLVDLGAGEMQGAIGKDTSWMDYAQFLSDYADGVGIPKSAHTSLFIIGGGDVIPMPEFYAHVGHDIKTIEDSDLLYCFPVDYAWKKVSIKDAIFNVARLPLDYVEKGTLNTTLEDDLGAYFARTIESLKEGIPFSYALMTSNAGKANRNDWTWTSADVMAKFPQQQLKNDGRLTKDNMFLCPALDVAGEEYNSSKEVEQYKHCLRHTDILFINLHGSPNKSISGYLGSDNHSSYFGLTIELMKQIRTPIINAFPCYGARYGRYYFDNNDSLFSSDYEIYDRGDSMLLTAFYESNVMLFAGSCTSSMCSSVIGNGSEADHINESNSAVDLLMPAGYAEAMLKLYTCYLIQGEPAGYAFLHAKIDYLNYRAKYENLDYVFLTLNQFNLFGCPTLYITPQDATHQLCEAYKTFDVEPKVLPNVNYKIEYNRFEQGIDGVLRRARTLVDNNLKELDERIRKQLYEQLELSEDNLCRIESIEYNGQQTYHLTYAKKNQIYPEFYVIQTDQQGNIKEILESR